MAMLCTRTTRRLLLGLVLMLHAICTHGLKRSRVHISDDLRDVEDDEEDEEWKEWGKPKKPEVPPNTKGFDLNGGPVDVQNLMAGQSQGPQLTFARLRPDPDRTEEDTKEIGNMWAALLKTAGMSDQVYPVDDSTLLISVSDGKYMDEIKDFVLSRDEAYEFEWKQQTFRRPGDPPLKKPNQEAPKEKPKRAKKGKKKKNKNKGAAGKEDL